MAHVMSTESSGSLPLRVPYANGFRKKYRLSLAMAMVHEYGHESIVDNWRRNAYSISISQTQHALEDTTAAEQAPEACSV
jgi:hypothetical protein